MATSTSTSATDFKTAFFETDKCIRLSLEVPGVQLKDLEVSVQRGVLLIRGLKKTAYRHDGTLYCKHHKFCRRFAVDTDVVDLNRMKANLTKGLLTVQAPKKSRQPTILSIPVSVGEEELLDEEEQKELQKREAAPVSSTPEAKAPAATTALKPTAAPLPNVVSKDTVQDEATMPITLTVKRNHRNANFKPHHYMTRRSMNKAA